MADWLVYQENGAHLGPWPAEVIARGIAEGRLPQAIYVALPGGPRWLRAIELPLIAQLVDEARAKPLQVARPKPDLSAFAATMNLSEDDVELSDIHVSAAPTPTVSSIPPPLPNALRSTMILPSSPPLPGQQKSPSAGPKPFAETVVLPNGLIADHLRRPGS